jgi:hypothetical protein
VPAALLAEVDDWHTGGFDSGQERAASVEKADLDGMSTLVQADRKLRQLSFRAPGFE